ncbi:lipocalin-like domain-containing protein [Dinghuibacter silviterrae]|uniref:Lipocalin-like protein n=1 Tax=Dinghuibacter silviterrae TaxID=1539049 RepID=A0A4R8DTB5_9BACT|nr:lipocalin-like domain-containing protein [Dinghuibacter silviterrae]TDX01524.1 lipocalin-like protein [Dinghuibacter silviterrae]
MKHLKKAAVFLLLAFTVTPTFSQSTLLAGTWRLTAADKILPDGSRVADFGEAPRGIAIFTADGHYVVEIFQTDGKDTVQNISCHFGTYTVDPSKGTITFHIDRASHAAWDGTTSVRAFTLEGDQLTWRVQPRPDGSIPVSVFSRM